MAISDKELRIWAGAAFDRFLSVPPERKAPLWAFDDFWKRSNTFDAALHFVTAVRTRWPKDKEIESRMRGIDALIFKNPAFFKPKLSDTSVWQDDYGWCGAACLSAREYCLQFRDSKEHVEAADDYLLIARNCWDNMKEFSWDATDEASPVAHGCLNRDRTNINDPEIKTKDDGTKNTVTNATFLRLCLGLYSVKNEGRYLDAAREQYAWFDTWFNSPQYGYLIGPHGGPCLIGERPRASPDYLKDDKPNWREGWVWTGDQGLMLAALREYFAAAQEIRGDRLDPIAVLNRVASGVKSFLFDKDDVLQEAPFRSSFNRAYAQDYVGGRGVLMRHLAPLVQSGKDFEPNIIATAKAVWDGRGPDNQFCADWNPGKKADFAKGYKTNLRLGDGSLPWDFKTKDGSDEALRMQAILQAAALDALGAAIRVSTPA